MLIFKTFACKYTNACTVKGGAYKGIGLSLQSKNWMAMDPKNPKPRIILQLLGFLLVEGTQLCSLDIGQDAMFPVSVNIDGRVWFFLSSITYILMLHV